MNGIVLGPIVENTPFMKTLIKHLGKSLKSTDHDVNLFGTALLVFLMIAFISSSFYIMISCIPG
jgi:hypothetical protein